LKLKKTKIKDNQTVTYLKLKILVSYFEDFYKNLDSVLNKFKNEYNFDSSSMPEQKFDIFAMFEGKGCLKIIVRRMFLR